MKKYYGVKQERNILHTIKRRKVNWIGHILRGNCRLNALLKGRYKGRLKAQEDEVEDVSSYWMNLGSEKILEIEK